jgi:uncharacterized membrane protein YphA (DoxX/SURF4 family)
MALPEINIILKATTDGFNRGVAAVDARLGRLEVGAQSAGARIAAVGDRLTLLGKRMTVVTGGLAAGATAAFALAQSTANAGDAIRDMARSSGVSTDFFQEMTFAMGQVSDMSQDDLGAALSKLNRTIGEAGEGSKGAIAALEQLGFTQEEIASGAVETEEAFSRYLETVSAMDDTGKAAALSTDLLGRSAAGLGPQLNGAAAEVDGLRDAAYGMGAVMSEDAIAASDKFNDQMKVVQAQLQGVRNTIGAELLPVFTEKLLPLIIDTVIPTFQRWAENIGEIIDWFANLPGPVQEAATAIGLALGAGGPILLALGVLSRAFAVLISTGPLGLFVALAVTAAAAWSVWGDDIKKFVGDAIDYVSEKFEAFMALLQHIIDKAVAVQKAVTDALSVGKTEMNSGGGYQGMAGAMDEFGAGMFEGQDGGGGTGAALSDGLVDGMSNRLIERAPDIQAALQAVTDQANAAFEINSPSRVFQRIGKFIGQGLAGGISDSQAMVATAVGTLGTAAEQSTSQMVSGVLGSLGALFNGSKKFAAAQALVNAWAGASEALKLPFPANLAAFAKVLATGLGAVKNINSAKPGATGGGGSAAGGGAAGGGASRAPDAGQYLNFQFTGGMTSTEEMGRFFVKSINQAIENGAVIRGARIV